MIRYQPSHHPSYVMQVESVKKMQLQMQIMDKSVSSTIPTVPYQHAAPAAVVPEMITAELSRMIRESSQLSMQEVLF